MGKNCGSPSASCCGAAAQSSPKRSCGSPRVDSASVDTIGSPNLSPIAKSTCGTPSCPSAEAPKTGSTQCSSEKSSELSSEFMNKLVLFMMESYEFVKSYKETTNNAQFGMSETERQAKIQELIALIARKEAELSELEREKAALDATPSSGMAELSSYWQNMGLSSPGDGADASCQVSQSATGYSDMSPYSMHISDLMSSFGGEVERSPPQSQYEGQSYGAGCDDSCVLEEYRSPPSQPYSPNSQQYYSNPERFASLMYSPQQYANSYTQARNNVAKRSTLSGNSASSCICPSDSPPSRSHRRR